MNIHRLHSNALPLLIVLGGAVRCDTEKPPELHMLRRVPLTAVTPAAEIQDSGDVRVESDCWGEDPLRVFLGVKYRSVEELSDQDFIPLDPSDAPDGSAQGKIQAAEREQIERDIAFEAAGLRQCARGMPFGVFVESSASGKVVDAHIEIERDVKLRRSGFACIRRALKRLHLPGGPAITTMHIDFPARHSSQEIVCGRGQRQPVSILPDL
jgi:hypothetical protein